MLATAGGNILTVDEPVPPNLVAHRGQPNERLFSSCAMLVSLNA
jgi:hypothetical protein